MVFAGALLVRQRSVESFRCCSRAHFGFYENVPCRVAAVHRFTYVWRNCNTPRMEVQPDIDTPQRIRYNTVDLWAQAIPAPDMIPMQSRLKLS